MAPSIINMTYTTIPTQSPTNILSQSAEKDNNDATISYDNDKDEYVMSFDDDDIYTTHIPESRRIILYRYKQYG